MSAKTKGSAHHRRGPDPTQLELPAPVAAGAPRPARPVHFVRYHDRPATLLAADQVSAALRARGIESHSLHPRDLLRVRGALLVFVRTSRIDHLLYARMRGNATLLDVLDTPVVHRRLGNARFFDGAIFRNRRQQSDFGRPRWVSRVLHQHWDPRHVPNEVPAGEFRAAYLGDRRSFAHFGELDGVAYIEGDWFRHAPQFNCHLSVREPGRDFLYRPNVQLATAAACRAVLVTTRDESATELLGDDYPFYCEPDRGSVEACLERARRASSGEASWRRALARLEEVREQLAIGRVAADFAEYFAEVERELDRRARSGDTRGMARRGPSAAGG